MGKKVCTSTYLTKVPFDVEVGKYGFALDYHISIHFEIGDRNLSRDEVFEMTKAK